MPKTAEEKAATKREWARRNPEKRRAAWEAWREKNRDYERKRQLEYYYANHEKRKASNRLFNRRRYGILDADANSKSGLCEICKQYSAPLHLDHCHETGAARGWLCPRCNTSLGKFEDSPLLMLTAVKYLLKNKDPNYMSQSPVDALDALIADFAKNSGVLPQVNPPEAVKVLETQTKPEVAGNPEPALELPAAPAPTEKPAEVVAAEAAKKTRGRKPAATAAEKQVDKAPESSGQPSQPDAAAALEAASNRDLFAECRRRGAEGMYGASTEDLLAEILRRLCRALPAPDA